MLLVWIETDDLEQGSQYSTSSALQEAGILDARAQAELKFLYVVSAQIYGEQNQGLKGAEGRQKAQDISYLMKMWVFTAIFLFTSIGLRSWDVSIFESEVATYNLFSGISFMFSGIVSVILLAFTGDCSCLRPKSYC
jgi:hypothetical protein